MNIRVPVLLTACYVFAACAGSPPESSPETSTTGHPVLTVELTSSRVVLAGRAAARRLSSGALAVSRDEYGRLAAGPAAVAMAGDPDGSEYLSLLVSCALPSGISLILGDPELPLEFPGEIGLAPAWEGAPLERADRRWVSACVLSQLNAEDLAVPVSLRGRRPALRAGAEERAIFSVEAGAFYGDLFGDPSRPLAWFACRGDGQVSDPSAGGLAGTCAGEDPGHPGASTCGLTFAGDCSQVCDPPRGPFRRCGSAREVVTQFVLP